MRVKSGIGVGDGFFSLEGMKMRDLMMCGCGPMPREMRVEMMVGMIGQNVKLTPKQVLVRAKALVDEIDVTSERERKNRFAARDAYGKAKETDKAFQRLRKTVEELKGLLAKAHRDYGDGWLPSENEEQAKTRREQAEKEYKRLYKEVQVKDKEWAGVTDKIAVRVAKRFKVTVEELRG